MFKIRRTRAVDTRQGILPSREELLFDSKVHIEDVFNLGKYYLRKVIVPDLKSHDYTKIIHIDMMYRDFEETIQKGGSFTRREWYNMHVTEEMHHCFEYKGDQPIMLNHIIHMFIDWVCAGKARSKDGTFVMRTNVDTPAMRNLLIKAAENTIEWLDRNTEVID